MSPKHRKPKRRRWRPLRRILRYYARRTRMRIKARVREALLKVNAPQEIARASRDFDPEGTNLRPVLQPYPWRHYVAPEDLERYAACIGGWEFEFELWPEDHKEIEQAAYDAAFEHFGPYVDSQPLNWLEALNEAARAVLPEKITN